MAPKLHSRKLMENQITAEAQALLVGRKIRRVRYMTEAEAHEEGWNGRPLRIELDSGAVLYAGADEEGNDAGALFGHVAGDHFCFGRFY